TLPPLPPRRNPAGKSLAAPKPPKRATKAVVPEPREARERPVPENRRSPNSPPWPGRPTLRPHRRRALRNSLISPIPSPRPVPRRRSPPLPGKRLARTGRTTGTGTIPTRAKPRDGRERKTVPEGRRANQKAKSTKTTKGVRVATG